MITTFKPIVKIKVEHVKQADTYKYKIELTELSTGIVKKMYRSAQASFCVTQIKKPLADMGLDIDAPNYNYVKGFAGYDIEEEAPSCEVVLKCDLVTAAPTTATPALVKRGRPKGAKNKEKAVTVKLERAGEVIINLIEYDKNMRRDMVFRNEFFVWNAYYPSNLHEPVASDIIELAGGGYTWNCYAGCDGATRKEVAAKIISAKVHI